MLSRTAWTTAKSCGTRTFCAAGSARLKALHAEALQMNITKKKEEEIQWTRQRNLPGMDVPEVLKLCPQDSMQLKKWKYRQQIRLDQEEKTSVVDDYLVREGAMTEEERAEKKAKIQALRDAKALYTGRQVTLPHMEDIQERYIEDDSLKLSKDDSPEEKKAKAMKQLEAYIARASQKLEELGEPDAELKELKSRAKEFMKDMGAVEALAEKGKEEMKDVELPEGVTNMASFTKHMLELQREIDELGSATAAERVGAEPLQELGLVRFNSLRDFDQELTKARELESRLTEEYTQRFGQLPDSVASLNAGGWEKHGKPLDLTEFEYMEKLDYSQFEAPPSEFEVTVMDAFKRRNERATASENDVTLVPRVPVPSGPVDRGTMTRALHLFRLQAIHDYVVKVKKEKKYHQEYMYRDLEDLGLVMDDPEYPWKSDVFEEQKLAMKNNPFWTQKQKEIYIVKLHQFLQSDVFTREFIDSATI